MIWENIVYKQNIINRIIWLKWSIMCNLFPYFYSYMMFQTKILNKYFVGILNDETINNSR